MNSFMPGALSSLQAPQITFEVWRDVWDHWRQAQGASRMRERYPHINPPPEWRRRNTTTMTVMFRVMGLFFVLRSGLVLVGSMGPH